jgi:putative membrane protein
LPGFGAARTVPFHAMPPSVLNLLARWLVLALGVLIATRMVPGIRCDGGATLVVVVVLLSFCNAVLRPLLLLFTLPFIVVTMGLGVVVINALLFLLVGKLVDGFHVAGFWPAVGGSLVVSVTNLLLSLFLRGRRPPPRPPRREDRRGGDVIDI